MSEAVHQIPRLSPSIGHKLTTESALSAWSAHRLLGGHRQKTTDSQREGSLWHAALLEEGKGIEVIDSDAFRTKEAKEAKAKAEHDGKIPIVAPKWEAMQGAIVKIREQLAAHDVLLDGVVEERMEWKEWSSNGTWVDCSGVIDHRQGLRIDDLKTGKTCVSLHVATSLVSKSHALLQDAAYRNAVAAKAGEDKERCVVRFVFVQTEEPFTVTPVTMSGEFRALSELRWQRAIDDWAKYLGRGTDRKYWPGPVEGCGIIHPPGWAMAQELEVEAMRS